MNVGILTSNDIRHRYFVNAIADAFNVTAIVHQDTGYVPADTEKDNLDIRTSKMLRMHFEERTRQEQAFCGHDAQIRSGHHECTVRFVDPRTLNSHDTVHFLTTAQVDVVLVYGTGLIKQPLLDAFGGRMINMHLGLSPYYRGTATNFYPLVNEQPEYVGATIHMIDAGIDTGPIIRHARADIAADEMPHTLGCKTILAGIEAVIMSLHEYESARLNPVDQWDVPNARLYLRKHYHPSQVVKLYELIDDGLFRRYVNRKAAVQDAMQLVNPVMLGEAATV